jgi:type III pantothenate kinase
MQVSNLGNKANKFLAIDIGNSTTSFILYEKENILFNINIENKKIKDESSCKEIFSPFIEKKIFIKGEIFGAAIASVVEELTKIILPSINKLLDIDIKLIHSDLKFSFINEYETNLIGIDRLCAIEATVNMMSTPVIVADFGTATTIDLLNKECKYIGGIIIPGIKTMALSLFEKTSQLPNVEIAIPDKWIGKNTEDCLQLGVVYGSRLLFEAFVDHFWKNLNYETNIIITGGLGKIVAENTKYDVKYLPNLVSNGIRHIYLKNFI